MVVNEATGHLPKLASDRVAIDAKEDDLVAEYRQHVDAGISAGPWRISVEDQIIPDFVAAVVDQMVE